MKNYLSALSLVVGVAMLSPSTSIAATKKVTLGKGHVQSVTVGGKRYLCGAPSKSWVPVKKVSSSKYELISAKTAHKSACRRLIARGRLKALNQLPDVSEMTRAAASAAVAPGVRTVSGTAPIISAVPGTDISTLFWRSGVVSGVASGTPTSEQCNEFWGGQNDGESAGQTACYMMQNVGEAIQSLQEAGTSLCYMREMPASASDAIDVVSGSLPSGGLRHIFDVPSGSTARVVRVDTTVSGQAGSSLFIKIFPQDSLDSSGAIYKYQLWECSNGSAVGTESAVVKLNGDFIATSQRSDSYTFSSTVRGYVVYTNGQVTFDTSRDRTADVQFADNSNIVVNKISVTSDNEIISKHKEQRGSETQNAYSISHFSGSSLSDLRFLEGAIKMSFVSNSFSNTFVGANEYRDTFYASAPGSAFSTRVTSFDFDGDSFYSSISAPSVDMDSFNCSATPTVRLSLDMANTAMQAVRTECESQRLDGFDMCYADSTLASAMQNYNSVCSH